MPSSVTVTVVGEMSMTMRCARACRSALLIASRTPPRRRWRCGHPAPGRPSPVTSIGVLECWTLAAGIAAATSVAVPADRPMVRPPAARGRGWPARRCAPARPRRPRRRDAGSRRRCRGPAPCAPVRGRGPPRRWHRAARSIVIVGAGLVDRCRATFRAVSTQDRRDRATRRPACSRASGCAVLPIPPDDLRAPDSVGRCDRKGNSLLWVVGRWRR